MNDVAGTDGEPIDRFVSIIEGAPNWYDLSFYLEFAVGGSELGSMRVGRALAYSNFDDMRKQRVLILKEQLTDQRGSFP